MTERMFFAPDEESARRARESLAQQTPATFSGIDILDGRIKTFAGLCSSSRTMEQVSPLASVGELRSGAANLSLFWARGVTRLA